MKNISKKTKVFIILGVIGISIVFGMVLILNQKWKINGNIVTKGNKKYEIGDYYEYDETIDNRLEGITDVKWKVFGVDDEGNLLIMSSSIVEELTLGSDKSILKTQQDIITAKNQMEQIAKKYSKGKYALYARTVNNNDINKLTGYKNAKNKNKVTFYWGEKDNPVTKNENNEIILSKLNHNKTFHWLDNNVWKQSYKDGSETNVTLKPINTFNDNLVSYDNQNYENLSFYIKENSKIYNMLYLEDNKERAIYWTSTNYTNVTENYVAYGYNVIKYDSLNYDNLLYSSGDTKEVTRGIRVIVAIKKTW